MSRGGSRHGAGRPAQNVRIESLKRLDVRYLHARGLLKPGTAFTQTWSMGERQTGAVGVTVTGGAVVLAYCHGASGDPVRVTLYLEQTACHYGGTRPWFRCPRCGHRVAVVCMAGALWGCRHCLRVRYQSQSEDQVQRTWRRTRKIEAQLKVGEDRPYGKPAGMRWATFARLHDELAAIEERRNAAFCVSIRRRFPELLR
ncbi:hypothetical protein ACO2Q2_00430 [Dyella sp. KRB-257]|uniref:hypothetical protein n=1 Tax=Dyella sp. KRB-257 TaxID=3400915 RepID=UPI003C08BA1D